MNAKIIEALKGVRDNLDIIIEESEGLLAPTEVEQERPKKVVEEKADSKEEKKDNVVPITKKVDAKVENELPNPDEEEITPELLEALTYNELKKFAKEIGVTATGARAELTKKILNAGQETEEEEEAEVEQEMPKKADNKVKTKSPVRLGKKEEVEEDEEEEEEIDPLVTRVNEAVEGMSDEDILDVLTDAGVKAKGKRQALISAVVKAVREGKIELGDEDDSHDEEEPEVGEETSEELDINDFDNEEMTDERRKAMQDFEATTIADFEEGAITRKDLVDWLNEYNDTKGAMKNKSDEEILEEYISLSWLLIDDEGEMPEEGAYTINGVPHCCGRELEYLEESNTFICEYCGTEYEGA